MTFKKIIDRLALAGVMSVLLAAAAFGQKTAEKPLPNLALDNINGQKWNLEEMRGSVVLLNFWATWCAPCQTEIAALQSIVFCVLSYFSSIVFNLPSQIY